MRLLAHDHSRQPWWFIAFDTLTNPCILYRFQEYIYQSGSWWFVGEVWGRQSFWIASGYWCFWIDFVQRILSSSEKIDTITNHVFVYWESCYQWRSVSHRSRWAAHQSLNTLVISTEQLWLRVLPVMWDIPSPWSRHAHTMESSVQAHGSLLLPGSIWYCYLGGRLLVLQDFDGQKSLSGEQFTHNAPTIPCRATNRFRTPSLRPRTVAQLRLSYCEWFMVPMAARFLSHTLRARHLVLRSCFQSSSSPRQLSSGIL